MASKKEVKTVRLKRLEGKLAVIEKSEEYLRNELSRLNSKERVIRDKISKEKKAIALVNRARRLR